MSIAVQGGNVAQWFVRAQRHLAAAVVLAGFAAGAACGWILGGSAAALVPAGSHLAKVWADANAATEGLLAEMVGPWDLLWVVLAPLPVALLGAAVMLLLHAALIRSPVAEAWVRLKTSSVAAVVAAVSGAALAFALAYCCGRDDLFAGASVETFASLIVVFGASLLTPPVLWRANRALGDPLESTRAKGVWVAAAAIICPGALLLAAHLDALQEDVFVVAVAVMLGAAFLGCIQIVSAATSPSVIPGSPEARAPIRYAIIFCVIALMIAVVDAALDLVGAVNILESALKLAAKSAGAPTP